ncbi:TetR/AcrR family transcriptional regulator [Hyphomonas sp.]|uniref:TetR/AcrR family transcriptional regulator n=1 Tax=Hyphomonas sp. TaxID=87 RepID=UPI0037C0DC04
MNAIVEAAARILADDGWQGVNTNAIARRAGVSVGSVYEYFPDKQAILAVIIDRHLAEGEDMLADAANGLAGGMAIDDIVSALVFGFIRLHEDDPRLHRALASEVPISAAQRKRIAALRSKIVTLVADVLSEHVDEAELKATLLVDTADALAHRWIVDEVGLPASADIMIAQASKMLKGYLSG